jgi:hypothetical protein
MPGWAWTISVVADIAFTETNSITVDGVKNQTFKAVLEAPVGLNTNTVMVDQLDCRSFKPSILVCIRTTKNPRMLLVHGPMSYVLILCYSIE